LLRLIVAFSYLIPFRFKNTDTYYIFIKNEGIFILDPYKSIIYQGFIGNKKAWGGIKTPKSDGLYRANNAALSPLNDLQLPFLDLLAED
jgi:hypothetical protein